MEISIFQKIILNEIPSIKIYEDERFIAILDVNPKNLGHTLVIPKKIQIDLLSEDNETIKDLFILVQKLSIRIKKNLEASGIKIVSNNGASSDQKVFHTHVHIIPSYIEKQDIVVDQNVADKINK